MKEGGRREGGGEIEEMEEGLIGKGANRTVRAKQGDSGKGPGIAGVLFP